MKYKAIYPVKDQQYIDTLLKAADKPKPPKLPKQAVCTAVRIGITSEVRPTTA